MNLLLYRFIDNALLLREKMSSKIIIEDTIENKKKYGIPLLPIYNSKYEVLKEEVIENIEPKDEKLVSLTFDEGTKEFTDSLIEVLERNKARATFFVFGNSIDYNKDSLKKIASHGNEIGIHGYTKTPFTMKDIDAVNNEISYTCDRLKEIGVIPSRIVRPPYGKLNETIKENIDTPLVLSNINLTNISNVDNIKESIVKKIAPGSIIKLSSTEVTLEALNQLLPLLIKDGYKFVTVSEMNRKYENKFEAGRVYAYIDTKKAA